MTTTPTVIAVSRDSGHHFSKPVVEEIVLVEGHGIEGDAHAGATVQHVSRMKREPAARNLRQVHLIHSELFDELRPEHKVAPGELGENVTTAGIDVLTLPRGTRLHLGDEAVVELTGLRNPCVQINRFQAGLMKAVLDKSEDGTLVRKSGVMSIVARGGTVRAGDPIRVELPQGPQLPLDVV